MLGVFVCLLPSCVLSDFSKTSIFEFSILFRFSFGLNNMNKHTAGSRAIGIYVTLHIICLIH